MAIILRLDRVMADRKISLKDLAEQVGIANINLSKIKTGKVSAIRFSRDCEKKSVNKILL
ncbi:helix-turn-helix domain-containing protein [Clostridioides difficile]|uniref:helix-turn-helix domain-containing protein n=1 Tax=Clostridioides difficile TaxID=1496 RepID=UPI002F330366